MAFPYSIFRGVASPKLGKDFILGIVDQNVAIREITESSDDDAHPFLFQARVPKFPGRFENATGVFCQLPSRHL